MAVNLNRLSSKLGQSLLSKLLYKLVCQNNLMISFFCVIVGRGGGAKRFIEIAMGNITKYSLNLPSKIIEGILKDVHL